MKIAYVDGQSYAGGVANTVRVAAMLEALEIGGHDLWVYRESTGAAPDPSFPVLARAAARAIPKAALLGRGVTTWLNSLPDAPDLVFCYGNDPRYLLRIQRWCRSRAVRLVVDLVDWYAASDVTGIGPKVFCLVNDYWVMRHLLEHCDGAVVVSRLLEQHCAKLDIPTLRVPAAINGLPTSPPNKRHGLTITYAGAPGRREASLLANLQQLAREGVLEQLGIELRVIGLAKDSDTGTDGEPGLTWLGRLAREETLRKIAESDFTVLQRSPLRRFARAGFPSKVAESLLLGVPVITNLTSDLDELLVDQKNSILLSGEDYQSLRDGLDRAVAWADSVDGLKIAGDAAGHFAPKSIEPLLTEFLVSQTGDATHGR